MAERLKKLTFNLKERLKNDVVLSSILITSITVIIKLFAAVKEIAVAYRFGVGDDLDAYLIAYLYVTFVILIISVSFASAIIPTYVDAKKKGHVSASALFRSITSWCFLFTLLAAFILFIIKPIILPLLGMGFDELKLAKTNTMVNILLPILIMWGMSTVWGSVLNAHKKFVVVALTPAIISISLILSIIWGTEKYGINAMAAGTLVGHFIELMVIMYYLRKEGLPLGFHFDRHSESIRKIVHQCLPLSISTLMSTGMGIVDQAMAGMLKSGSVSALNYGYRLVGILISLSASLWVVALPHFSALACEGNYYKLKGSLYRYCRFALLVSIPTVILLVIVSTQIVEIFFERGAFMSNDTILVSHIQRFYLLQLPFFITGVIIMRFLSSINMNKVLMWGGVSGFFLNIILNSFFIQFLGVAGIALSTSVVSFTIFIFLLFVLKKLFLKENYLS